jgi:hypothetical protein
MNVAYAWIMKPPTVLPQGKLCGIIYAETLPKGYVIVYSCDSSDLLYGRDKDVIDAWTNTALRPFTRLPYKLTRSGRPRKEVDIPG